MKRPIDLLKHVWSAPLAGALALFLLPPIMGADELVALIAPSTNLDERAVSAVDTDSEPLSLQDIFEFGELGPPPGAPGSMPLSDAEQAALDAAIRASEESPLAEAERHSVTSGPTGTAVLQESSR